MSFFEHLIELREQRVDLGARLRRLLFIDQARMAGRLAQAQQRFEHLELHLAHAVTMSVFQQSRAVIVAQLIIEFSIPRLEIAINRLLGFCRQLARNLSLRPP